MLEKFKNHIEQKLPFLKEGNLLIAISGGIDSVVLTHLLHQLNYSIALAHCNFKLRFEDSDKDEVFVKRLAEKLKVKCFTTSFSTQDYANNNNLSIQMAARELRYNWFNELLKQENYQYVLTAHQLNDNVETVLINLTRGANIQGLTGIPEINGNIIRPLLPFSRNEIQQFTIDNQISWREDESNQSTKYFRNKIRHKVIPVLQELNANLLHTFQEHLGYLKEEKEVLEKHLNEVKNDLCFEEENQLKIDIKKLKKYKNFKVYLYHILKGCGFSEWANIADLLDAQAGKYVASKTHRLIKDRGFLLLTKNDILLLDSVYEIPLKTSVISKPISLQFQEVNQLEKNTSSKVFLDKSKLQYPLRLRKRKDGDVFYPFGMKGKKKISKFFKDEKMSLIEKENTWLLCNANDDIIWVVGKRLNSEFVVKQTTDKILKVTLNY
ncbi:tRNA lysidine(34) synthetase TilS [Pseudofulvibacter geojedonensis]|uniref:tRNA(Ile)-lysidine synthase n=1 Tax=Pseudofulvibacter geojedonensis TaxID=1123758 RepID=A0ABW3HYC1_9FLAO